MTLHSNLVIFKLYYLDTHKTAVLSLHSNLVIFKSKKPKSNFQLSKLYIPIWLYSNDFIPFDGDIIFDFTFQSGYIQILNPLFMQCH